VVRYRVAVGNYALWQAFDNHYWPALCFVDTKGGIRHHLSEGESQESDLVLQKVLAQAGGACRSPAVAILSPMHAHCYGAVPHTPI
jgi:hypothetical protein